MLYMFLIELRWERLEDPLYLRTSLRKEPTALHKEQSFKITTKSVVPAAKTHHKTPTTQAAILPTQTHYHRKI